MSGILVGVDGSDHSRRALDWAMREAALRHVPLTVMTVHPHLARPATGIYWGVPDLPENSLDPDLAQATVQELVDEIAKEIAEIPELTVRVVIGDPAEELVKSSRDADLLVVGFRGSGEFAKLLMGSVSSKVAHHAACPVVVIPGAR